MSDQNYAPYSFQTLKPKSKGKSYKDYVKEAIDKGDITKNDLTRDHGDGMAKVYKVHLYKICKY